MSVYPGSNNRKAITHVGSLSADDALLQEKLRFRKSCDRSLNLKPGRIVSREPVWILVEFERIGHSPHDSEILQADRSEIGFLIFILTGRNEPQRSVIIPTYPRTGNSATLEKPDIFFGDSPVKALAKCSSEIGAYGIAKDFR